eukprot:631840-Prymnesium_polylepis.2
MEPGCCGCPGCCRSLALHPWPLLQHLTPCSCVAKRMRSVTAEAEWHCSTCRPRCERPPSLRGAQCLHEMWQIWNWIFGHVTWDLRHVQTRLHG